MNVAPGRQAAVHVVSENPEILEMFRRAGEFFKMLSRASEVQLQSDKTGIADDAVSVVIAGATLYIPFAELVDIAAEKERLEKEKNRLAGELKRSESMLTNEKFLSKAPQAKIDEEKAKQEKYKAMMAQVEERLKSLS